MSTGGIKLFSWSRSHWRLTFSQSPGKTKLLLLATIETHAMKHRDRWHPALRAGGKLTAAGSYHSCNLCSCWVSVWPCVVVVPPPLFSLRRMLGWRKGQSVSLCRMWVFYSVAEPGFCPDYTTTIASVWCPSLCLPRLWLRHSQTIPRPGCNFGKLLEQSSPISLQSQTHFNHT